MVKLFANSGDADQTPHSVASDLGLHCLPITLFYGSPDYNGLSKLVAFTQNFSEFLLVLWHSFTRIRISSRHKALKQHNKKKKKKIEFTFEWMLKQCCINSFPASGDFCCLLTTLANSLGLAHFVGPDLDPNCLTLSWYSWKIFLKKLISKTKFTDDKKAYKITQHAKS